MESGEISNDRLRATFDSGWAMISLQVSVHPYSAIPVLRTSNKISQFLAPPDLRFGEHLDSGASLVLVSSWHDDTGQPTRLVARSMMQDMPNNVGELCHVHVCLPRVLRMHSGLLCVRSRT
jgi:hypothetical protein